MTIRLSRILLFTAAVSLFPALAPAQTPTVVTPAFDFSGVLFGAYGYRTDSAAKAATGGKNPNQFTLDRAYLTFRMPAGDNGAIRVTTDIFQNTNNSTNQFYQGWLVRIKYGYLQYTGLRDAFGNGSSLVGRIGILHTVVIDHEEGYWPRYLNQVALERNGFFSSADGGVAGLLTLGNKMGEIYGTITNGPGYSSFEKDRFKDFALRVSLTPWANSKTNAIVKSIAFSPWAYKGWTASNFAAGGAGQTGSVTDGLQRDRYGVFLGVKDRRLTGGAEWAVRKDEGSESGANTIASPRVVRDSTGRLLDGFILVRPLEWINPNKKSGLQLIGRYDHFTPSTDPQGPNYAGTTPKYNFAILGASYELNQRMTFALDWQVQTPSDFPPAVGTNVRPAPRNSTIFLNWQANF